MISIALLGAGIFAREEHLPAIEAASDLLQLKAVYSRSQKSAEALQTKTKVDVYYDSPESPDKTLDHLLSREDIDAVVVCLPITNQPAIIQKALAAGKHVLSEKPIAKDVETGRALLDWHGRQTSSRVWAVAENFRFGDDLSAAAARVKELGGQLQTFSLRLFGFVKDEDKYFNTEWRKVPDYQGGFLLDGGVHFIAGLRMLLNAAGHEVAQVSARSALLQQKLPPVDTVHGILSTDGGAIGTVSLTWGAEFKSCFDMDVVTTNGAVFLRPGEVKTVRGSAGDKAEDIKEFQRSSGVKAEVRAFAESIAAGKVDPRQAPLQAFKDLEVLQALLESGEAGAATKDIKA